MNEANNEANGGRGPRIVAEHTVVLYRPSDGRVAHIHRVRVFEGGKDVTSEEAEREAVANAQRMGHAVESLRAIHVHELPTGQGALHYDANANKLHRTGGDTTPRRRRRGTT